MTQSPPLSALPSTLMRLASGWEAITSFLQQSSRGGILRACIVEMQAVCRRQRISRLRKSWTGHTRRITHLIATEISQGLPLLETSEVFSDKLLARYELPITFFVPGHPTEPFPESMESILAAGHEGVHHPSAQRAYEERRSLEQGLVVLEGSIEHVLSVDGARFACIGDVALALTAVEEG